MKAALHRKRPDYRGVLSFMAQASEDVTAEESAGILRWGTRLRLGCATKQLPAAAKILHWMERIGA
eukprot:4345821-Lingulodinium_polyedra.AAC.1